MKTIFHYFIEQLCAQLIVLTCDAKHQRTHAHVHCVCVSNSEGLWVLVYQYVSFLFLSTYCICIHESVCVGVCVQRV